MSDPAPEQELQSVGAEDVSEADEESQLLPSEAPPTPQQQPGKQNLK